MKTTWSWAVPVLAGAAGVTLVASGPAATAGAARTAGAAGAAHSSQPAYLSVPDRLYSVAATGPHNVWAVGLTPSSSLIMHFNGSRWAVAFTLPVGYFNGAAVASYRNAWAVGATNWFSPTQTLAEHWNGKSWSRVPTPSPGGGGYFSGVAATSASNAWAVGLIGPGGNGVPAATVPLIERWNGRRWRVQPFPEPADGGQFRAVAASSASNAWAVGNTGATSEGTGQQTLIDHWNGKRWTQVPSPNLPGTSNSLSGVTVLGPLNAWAVGFTTASSGLWKSLILHWNGRHWQVQPSPNPTGDTDLWDVAAAARRDAWAVGYTNPSSCNPQCATAIFHWNGRNWAVVPSPNASSGHLNALLGVVAISSSDAWAVGTTDYAATLIAHWDGRAWN
jgi:hypothetical protein